MPVGSAFLATSVGALLELRNHLSSVTVPSAMLWLVEQNHHQASPHVESPTTEFTEDLLIVSHMQVAPESTVQFPLEAADKAWDITEAPSSL